MSGVKGQKSAKYLIEPFHNQEWRCDSEEAARSSLGISRAEHQEASSLYHMLLPNYLAVVSLLTIQVTPLFW